jgi:NAD-dependent deacetylase
VDWLLTDTDGIAQVDRAAELLAGAGAVVALTGAGMSHESGVPTFRDAQTGLWARYDPTELATEDAFRRNPALVFGWYLMRLRLVRAASPHAGHHALVSMEEWCKRFAVVTQNVDGLHRRAGSRDVVELHGSLESFRCFDRGHPFDTMRLEGVEAPATGAVDPPACEECGSPIRPGVVWFGETLPPGALERAWELVERCDALLVIGTSSVVYPAAALPELAARRGAMVIEINPQQTPLTPRADLWWPQSARSALPALMGRLTSSDPTP